MDHLVYVKKLNAKSIEKKSSYIWTAMTNV
jgi:hypothetical protein